MSMYGEPYRALDVSGESRTKQSFRDECDIENIVAKYVKTGLVSHLAGGQPFYADVSEMADYRGAIEQVRSAEKFFAGLPAKVRAFFENDIATFVDWMADPANADQLEKLGVRILDGKAPEGADLVPEPEATVEPPPAPTVAEEATQ